MRAMRSASAVCMPSPYDSHTSARTETCAPYRHAVLDDVAASTDPYPAYARLRNRGVHHADDGRVVVARRADVLQALGDPRLVIPCAPLAPEALANVRSVMARFSDGPDHTR